MTNYQNWNKEDSNTLLITSQKKGEAGRNKNQASALTSNHATLNAN